jgi:integrase
MRGSFHRVVERAGVPKIRLHDLRRTAATVLLGARVNPKVVSEMLGQSAISIRRDDDAGAALPERVTVVKNGVNALR